RAVADIEAVREAALPQPAQPESQTEAELGPAERQFEARAVRRAADAAAFHLQPGLEPARGIAVQVAGEFLERQFGGARDDFRQRRSSMVDDPSPGTWSNARSSSLCPARGEPQPGSSRKPIHS